MSKKKSNAKKTTTKKTGKKAAANKSTEKRRKEAIAAIEQNIARVDGEALADAARANRRKAAAKEGKARMIADAARAEGAPKTKAALAGGKKPRTAKPAKEKRASGLDLAANVLVEAKEPLDAKTIAQRAIAAGWKTNGKTPHATLYAAIIREISDKGSESRFRKVDRGRFEATKAAKK